MQGVSYKKNMRPNTSSVYALAFIIPAAYQGNKNQSRFPTDDLCKKHAMAIFVLSRWQEFKPRSALYEWTRYDPGWGSDTLLSDQVMFGGPEGSMRRPMDNWLAKLFGEKIADNVLVLRYKKGEWPKPSDFSGLL